MIEIIAAGALFMGTIMGIGVGAALRTSGRESRQEERELDMISHREALKRYKTNDYTKK